MFSGVFSNQADLAPNFAGTLMALTNMLATIPGILVPTLVGIMTHGTNGLAPWHTGETILSFSLNKKCNFSDEFDLTEQSCSVWDDGRNSSLWSCSLFDLWEGRHTSGSQNQWKFNQIHVDSILPSVLEQQWRKKNTLKSNPILWQNFKISHVFL